MYKHLFETLLSILLGEFTRKWNCWIRRLALTLKATVYCVLTMCQELG